MRQNQEGSPLNGESRRAANRGWLTSNAGWAEWRYWWYGARLYIATGELANPNIPSEMA
jgi:hypothetical protein